jgi:flap endonuclease-1
MGIQYLNRFLLDHCKKSSIQKKNLSALARKIIAIDVSIYLYKFVSENALIEHLYLMISLLRHYQIIPIFVFDGKPPIEKRELLLQRRLHKREAEEKYQLLKLSMDSQTDVDADLLKELDALKKQMTTITFDHLQQAKDIMDAYGVHYICAEGEADVLCAQLVTSGKAWGCMSDDMDMFVYGCPRVFRQLSMMNHSIMFYDTPAILDDLGMDFATFQQIAILSGTDYSAESSHSLKKTMQYFRDYQKSEKDAPFCTWLKNTSNYMETVYFESVLSLFEVADLDEKYNGEYTNKPVRLPELKQLMREDGFVFVS